MTINKIIHGDNNYRVSKVKICQEVKVDMPAQHMLKKAPIYMHKDLTHRKCNAIVNQLIIPKRKASCLYVKKPQTGTYNASLDKCVDLYSWIPTNVQEMTIAQFKRYYKKNDMKPN